MKMILGALSLRSATIEWAPVFNHPFRLVHQRQKRVVDSLGCMRSELDADLVSIEWITPILVEIEERIGRDYQGPLKIQIRFGMKIEQVSAEHKDNRIRTTFSQFADEEYLVLHVSCHHPDIADRLALDSGENLPQHEF